MPTEATNRVYSIVEMLRAYKMRREPSLMFTS